MKKEYVSKIFALIGFLLLAFVALNMNACGKDKTAGNNNGLYGQYGYGGGVGNGVLGNGIGQSGDGMLTLQLTFSGQNGGMAGAMGTLFVQGGSPGCALPPGQYSLQTAQPGQYFNGDFANITLVATNNQGISIMISRGWLTNQQDQYGNRRMFADTSIPGCPTIFN
jgi:hypothetical protein